MRILQSITVGLLLLSAARTARADILLVITTDSNLNDNGGVDEFVPLTADGSTQTMYVWGAATPHEETVFEFNLDLSASGGALASDSVTIAPFFSAVAGSLSDTDLNDLQFGWTAFFGTAPVEPTCPAYTLFAMLDVSVAPGAKSGPDTTIRLQGPDFRMTSQIDGRLVPIPTSGLSRPLLSPDVVTTCADLETTCGDGLVEGDEECDPPDDVNCDQDCRRIVKCADGVVDPDEECDDGNISDGDGCDALCRLEPLANDDCATATALFDGDTLFYTNQAMTDGPGHPGICQFDGQTYNDIWYEYTASCTGELTISLCGSAYDTDLVIYRDCQCALSEADVLACNDDGCPDPPPDAYRSRVAVLVLQGNCYKIRVGGWSANDAGAGVLHVSCEHCETDSECDDGLFCTGPERCTDGLCQIGVPPCFDQFCDDVADACVPFPDGDVDRDGDVDLDDVGAFVPCLRGPNDSLPQCVTSDFDGDGFVDLTDFSVLQAGFTGGAP